MLGGGGRVEDVSKDCGGWHQEGPAQHRDDKKRMKLGGRGT